MVCVYDEFLKTTTKRKNIYVEKTLPLEIWKTILFMYKSWDGKKLYFLQA